MSRRLELFFFTVQLPVGCPIKRGYCWSRYGRAANCTGSFLCDTCRIEPGRIGDRAFNQNHSVQTTPRLRIVMLCFLVLRSSSDDEMAGLGRVSILHEQ